LDRLQQFSNLVGLIFDAAVDPQAWTKALDAMADAVGARIGTLHSYDARTATHAALAPRIAPEDLRLFNEE
jgi:hypothetical protein